MEMTYSWIIYSCLIFGSGILCDRKLESRPASSPPFVTNNTLRSGRSKHLRNTERKFNCPSGVSIKTSMVCDGVKDCSDGSDETKVLCVGKHHRRNMKTACGKVYHADQSLIPNGQRASHGTAPWNAGIYRFSETYSEYDIICGGSIISSNLVISAARCFWETSKRSNRIIKDDGKYKIAVGKYDRNISIVDNIYTQIMTVGSIYLKETFHGVSGFYAEDVAIVELKNRISFSHYVLPICIDWDGKYNQVNGDRGKVVGWGCAITGSTSHVLLELSLPYIDHRTCRKMYTNGFEAYVTSDKFCAGSALGPGKGVEVGYAGAGLGFLHANSYYLTGITNVKDTESNNSVGLFTEVNYHVRWIRELYEKHNSLK